jgi:hypothetical protein
MPEELVQERIISGVGVLRNTSTATDVRRYTLFVDVIRYSYPDYRSKKYSPDRQRYATMVLLRDGYVVAEVPIDYEKRRYDYVLDSPGQTLLAVKCQYKGVLQSFANLGTALGLTVVSVQDTIKDFKNLNLNWDEARFVCEGSSALQVRLYQSKYESCDSALTKEDKPTPPPPGRTPVPPTTPITDISRPYDNDTVTQPNSTDALSPPPSSFPYGTSNKRYKVYAYLQPVNGLGQVTGSPVFGAGLRVWGKIESLSVDSVTGNGFRFRALAHGEYDIEQYQATAKYANYSAAGIFLGQYQIKDADTDVILWTGSQ